MCTSVSPCVISDLKKKLLSPTSSLPHKYRLLFSLRNVPGPLAEAALVAALNDPSTLFRHDVAFCLGQRQQPTAIKTLSDLLSDHKEHPIVRHEAAEALGAIGTPECVALLKCFTGDSSREVAETCTLALQRIDHLDRFQVEKENRGDESKSRYLSVDPAPATSASIGVNELREILLDEEAEMFERYGALFGLRNRSGAEAVRAIGSAFGSESALLKHEVAYVLGQIQSPEATGYLMQVLKDAGEHAMVRHEAAEALGSIADESCVALLKAFSSDPEPIVAESCLVALDVLEHNASGEFQYAELGLAS